MIRLCAVEDVEDNGSAGYTAELDGEPARLMVIRSGGRVFVYVNSCPHRRLPLDFHPGRFLTEDRRHILCTNHIALFGIEDGACVDGPCRDQALKAVPFVVRDGIVWV